MKELILIGLLIILIVFTSGCTNLSKPTEEYCSEDQHYGLSTNSTCSSDNDCVIDGCNGEICRSKSEESISSTCVYNPPYPKDLGCSCRCIDSKCMWAK